jgi:endo-1,4-beta-D-glucanase Y
VAAKHVTFWKMKVKPGKLDEIRSIMSSPADQERIKKMGWQMTVIGSSKDNSNEVWGMVTWDNSDNYKKNADSSAQDADFQKMRALLEADPEWHDCDVQEISHA